MKDWEKRITPEAIESLKGNQIFVFGSNLLGKHGAGAAYLAFVNNWISKGNGLTMEVTEYKDGSFIGAYPIPTKGLKIETLSLEVVKYFVDIFIEIAKRESTYDFLVTEIGCGLAGYRPEQIAPLFKEAVFYDNIHLPRRFWDVILKDELI